MKEHISILERQVPELIVIGDELREMYRAIEAKKKDAIAKYWKLANKKVRHKETGKIYYAKPHDAFNAQFISAVIRYDLHKTPAMKRTVDYAYADEIEEVLEDQ